MVHRWFLFRNAVNIVYTCVMALNKVSCEYGQTIESTSCFPEFTSETNLTVDRRSPQLMQSFVLSRSITGLPWTKAPPMDPVDQGRSVGEQSGKGWGGGLVMINLKL